MKKIDLKTATNNELLAELILINNAYEGAVQAIGVPPDSVYADEYADIGGFISKGKELAEYKREIDAEYQSRKIRKS